MNNLELTLRAWVAMSQPPLLKVKNSQIAAVSVLIRREVGGEESRKLERRNVWTEETRPTMEKVRSKKR